MSLLSPYSRAASALQRALDAALIVAGLYCANAWLDHEWHAGLNVGAGAAAAVFLLLGEMRHLYGGSRLQSIEEEFKGVLLAWSVTCGTLLVVAFLLEASSTYSRLTSVLWFTTTPAVLIGARLALRAWLSRTDRSTRTVAVAGCSRVADGILHRVEKASASGIRVVGVFDDRAKERIGGELENLFRHVGDLAALVERARRGEIDYIFIALPLRAERRIVELADRLADTTASVYVVPDLFVFDLMRARWTMLGRMPTVSVYESPFDGLNGALKRLEDLVLGSLLLGVAALPMALIALAIKLTTRGPVLFKQRRYGLNGRPIQVLKFRTMTTAEDGDRVAQASRADPRVTPLGRLLRATSLDELPQLFNVLLGTMSLVGPRPHAVAHNEEYRGLIHGYMLRHKVKPGITGWAQVNGWRGETDTLDKMKHRVEHDLEYLRNWSLVLDLRILASTVTTVLARKNAY